MATITLNKPEKFSLELTSTWTWSAAGTEMGTTNWVSVFTRQVANGQSTLEYDLTNFLPNNTKITNVDLALKWDFISSPTTSNINVTIGDQSKNLKTFPGITMTFTNVAYTLNGKNLSLAFHSKYTGTKPSGYVQSTTKPENGRAGRFLNGDTAVTVTVTYEYVYTKLSTPVPSFSANPCLDSTTLSWTTSVSSSGVNKAGSYEVYKNNTKIGSVTSMIESKWQFEIKDSNLPAQGSTATYSVKAINSTSQGGSTYDSDMSTSITLKRYGATRSDYLAINFHSNSNSTNANPIYVGAQGQSGITITIVPHYDTPIYDSITSRTLTWKANASSTTSSIISEPNADGSWTKSGNITETGDSIIGIYTFTVKYASGRSQSVSGEVKQLGAPAATTFTTQPATKAGITASSYTYNWNKISLANSIIKYVYTTHMYDSNGKDQSSSAVIDKTSYTMPIDTCGYGKEFWITILVRAYASYGGYTDAANGTKSNIAFRVSPIGDIIVGLAGIVNEAGATNSNYTYNKTQISWDYYLVTGQGALKTLKYEIDGSLNGTIAIQPAEDSTERRQQGSYNDILIANLAAGSRSYSLTFTDEYGLTKTYTKTIIKVEPPKVALNSVSFNGENYTATLNFTITPPATAPDSEIRFIVEEGYKRGNEYNNETPQNWNHRTSYGKDLIIKSDTFPKLYNKLVPETGIPLGQTIITYRIKAYDNNIPVAIGYSNTIDRLIDFTITPTITGKLSITNTTKDGMTYASSKDLISIDASAIKIFAESSKIGMTRNFSAHCTKTLQKEYTTSMALSNNKATDSVPAEWASDTSWTYHVIASMNYLAEDETSIITRTATSAAANFPIKRWVTPVVNLRNLEYITSQQNPINIRGTLQSLTDKWGRSLDTANIFKIEIRIYDGENQIAFYSLDEDEVKTSNESTFRIAQTTETERDISAVLTITSTSNQTYTVSIPAIKLKPTAIPFAIRQYGIGTNVGKEWDITKTEPALQIIGNQTPTVATFSNGSSQQTTDVSIVNDATVGSAGKARLSLNKDGDNWTLSIFFD